MTALRFFALACASVCMIAAPSARAQEEAPPPLTYQAPPPAYPSGEYDSGAPSYHPVDPGYQAPPAPGPAQEPSPYPPPPPYPVPPAPAAPAPVDGAPTSPCTVTAAHGRQQPEIREEDVLAAAEGTFGKGAKGLAQMIEKIFKDRGRPNAYIAGREAGGAFVVGVRYGSGIMCHQIEGNSRIFWTGPSIGFDAGADANKVFVLVYNLHDSQELYRRFPATEGRAYLVGGFSASVLQRNDVLLVPIRLGVGVRLGVNAGYMNFSKKSRWLPF